MFKKIYAPSLLVAEALGLCEAASLAWNLHLQFVLLESDNQSLVETCKGNQKKGEFSGFVENIINIRSTFDSSWATWICRDGNGVAHEIARLATELSLQKKTWRWILMTENW